MEGPVAPVQISSQTARDGLSASGPPAPSALGLLGVFVQLLQVGAPPSTQTRTPVCPPAGISCWRVGVLMFGLTCPVRVPGLHRALHPTRGRARLALAAAPPRTPPTPATPPSTAPSAAAAPGVCFSFSHSKY